MVRDLSVIILTHNDEKVVNFALRSVKGWAGEIIVVDDESTDGTVEIVKKYTPKVFIKRLESFAKQREYALSKIRSDWVYYLDSDEELTSDLKNEIEEIVSTDTDEAKSAYFVCRRNIYLGREWPVKDRVERLFRRSRLKSWLGRVHESPIVEGEKGELKNCLIHSHRNLSEMIENTLSWSKTEAELMFEAGHPKVTVFHLLKVSLSEFFKYFVLQQGFRVGMIGFIKSCYQSYAGVLSYMRLWEMQNRVKS